MSSMTKVQLHNALISHGIPLPPVGAKREEFEKLYLQHVKKDVGDFSSDDEVDAPAATIKTPNPSGSPTLGDMDKEDAKEFVATLSDKQVYEMLLELGQTVGPVVETTRSVYKHLLATMLSGQKRLSEAQETNMNGNGVEDHGVEEYSDTDGEDEGEDLEGDAPNNYEDFYQSFTEKNMNRDVGHEVEERRRSLRGSPKSLRESASTSISRESSKGLTKQKVEKKEEKAPTTYRRTPTPNPQLSRNVVPRTLDWDEAEPQPTCLKRKTMKKSSEGEALNGTQKEGGQEHPVLSSMVVVFMAACVVLSAAYYFNFIWKNQGDEVDAELDAILSNLD